MTIFLERAQHFFLLFFEIRRTTTRPTEIVSTQAVNNAY